MPGKKGKNWIALGVAVFVVYLFLASVPVGIETRLRPNWLCPIEDARGRTPTALPAEDAGIPFQIGKFYGYFNGDGRFSFVRETEARLSLAPDAWAEYGPSPETIEVKNSTGSVLFTVKERGYPYFADGKTFIIGPEQNSIAALDQSGQVTWRRDFSAPITCADASSGLSVFGLLDGTIEILNDVGERVFGFEPGGSRLSVIVAAKLSPDGRRLVVFSGVEPQRFLMLERSGHTYKVVHHEYIGAGFRRPIRTAFVGDAKFVAFESEKGLTVYDIESRKTYPVNIRGQVSSFEDQSTGPLFFCLTEQGEGHELVGIELPDAVFMRAPFASGESFLARRGNRLYLSGASSIAALDLETK